jgi:acyl-CoA thioesterase-1
MKKFFLIILFAIFTYSSSAFASTKTVLVFGDSLSANYGIPMESGWVALLTQRLQSKNTDYRIVNASISGETTLGGRNRIQQALETHQPEIVILELGANDGLRGISIKSIYDNLAAVIEICQKRNAVVLLAGMQLPPNYGITYTQKFQAIFPQLAEHYRVKLVPFLLAGFGEKREFFQSDGIHPNEVAQEKIVDNVWEILQTMVKADQIITSPEI